MNTRSKNRSCQEVVALDIIPITLVGHNLGKRHRHLNSLVNDAFEKKVPFELVQNLEEKSPIDRLFKIDLAAKYKNCDYILQNFKDEDMLFVSKAMKCLWLVQDPKYSFIINPVYLEETLYPEMLTTASNKMKHWIVLNLKDGRRCQQFYMHYKNKDTDYALKFLPKCPANVIQQEMTHIPVKKITPHFLKMLCERTTEAAKIYFKQLKTEQPDKVYVQNMQILLKIDPELYFYVLETCFYKGCIRLNKDATKYIMRHHRHRFDAKPELYVGWILHLPTLANFLNNEQIKQVVTKLARAGYLYTHSEWPNRQFTYKFAEPLLKQMDRKERNSFCKQIFQTKSFGAIVTKPPYNMPSKPSQKPECTCICYSLESHDYDGLLDGPQKFPMLRGGGGGGGGPCFYQSPLDKLFDQYRFSSFEVTFAELRKRIPKEGSMDDRQNMMLVLVSKSGGRADSLAELMQLLVPRHTNEPANLRATIVRSLTKRAAAWRMTPDTWDLLMQFGRDLGLDGDNAISECKEGLHAVVLRHLLRGSQCPPAVWGAFLENLSLFKEYPLNPTERCLLYARLPSLLLPKSIGKATFDGLDKFLNVLQEYRISVESYPRAIHMIADLARRNPSAACPLLKRLFIARDARRQLLEENFAIIQTGASYLNVLRHDASLLDSGDKFSKLLEGSVSALHHEGFLRKLAIFFSEKNGLSERYLTLLKHSNAVKPHPKISRHMKKLAEARIKQLLAGLNVGYEPKPKRPRIDQESDVKYLASMANWIHTCSPASLQRQMMELLAEPRLAQLVLALRAPSQPGLIATTLAAAALQRPVHVACIALRIIRANQRHHAPDWQALISLITKLDLHSQQEKTYCYLVKLNDLPAEIRLDYCTTMYKILSKKGFEGRVGNICRGPTYRVALPLIACIRDNSHQLSSDFIRNILKTFLDHDFCKCKMKINFLDNNNVIDVNRPHIRKQCHSYRFCGEALREYYYRRYVSICLNIMTRFLIACDSVSDRNICRQFLNKVQKYWNLREFRSSSHFYGRAYKSDGETILVPFLKGLISMDAFLNPSLPDRYLPILEMVRATYDAVAPIHEFFDTNYNIKLTMLLRKAVKRSVMEKPALYKGQKMRPASAKHIKREATPASLKHIAFTFGKIVAEDIEDLVSENFPSIRTFYCRTFHTYLNRDINNLLSTDYIIGGVINDENKINAILLGLYLLKNTNNYKTDGMQRLRTIRNKEVMFFISAMLEGFNFN